MKYRQTLTVAFVLCCSATVWARQPAERAAASSAANYIIGGHDVLVITSYDQSELSGQFVVETDGTFSYPMLGRFQAAGMTLREAEAELRDQLVERGLFTKPQVTVAVDQCRSQKVFVLGEVRKPGVHTLSGTMRLVEALALADSTLPTSGGEAVILPAGGSEDQSVVRINLRDLENGKFAQNVTLRDGDTIFVPRAEDVYVFGQVKSPGAYPRRQDDMTVLQALSLAGGVTDRGSTGRIEIVRIVDHERVEIRAEFADEVLAGDTIIVPERFF